MDGKSVLVDTNVIVYLIGGHRKAADLLINHSLHFSFITEIELLSFKKLTKAEGQIIRQILAEGLVFQSDSVITSLATTIRLDHGLEVPDAIIAATAIRYNLPLVSADSDLSKVRGLQLIQYSL
jgi:predicted nucleic acid-binding protein